MKKFIFAVLGSSLLALTILSSMGYWQVGAQSYSQQTGQPLQNASQSVANNTGSASNTQQTSTAGQTDANMTQQLHAHLDAAIIAAKNNDTQGVMSSLSQLLQSLGNLSSPATETAGTNNTITATNQTDGVGNSSSVTDTNRAVTGGKAGDVDTPVTEGPEKLPSDFPDK